MRFNEAVTIAYDLAVFMYFTAIEIIENLLLALIPRKYIKRKNIQGEIALVTGGAGGIGRLIAIKLAALGVHVVIWDIDESGIEKVVVEIRSLGGLCTGYFCDITDKKKIYQVAKTVKTEIGKVTILVNNAGYAYLETLENTRDEEIERIFNVNIISHYWITKSFLGEMMKNNHGHIVTVASAAGLIPVYKGTGYSVTKFAVVGYHKNLSIDLKMHGYDGIHTTLVCSYFVHSVGLFPNAKPRLIPAMKADYVAEEIIFGILTNKINVTLPWIMRIAAVFAEFLPAKSLILFVKKVYHAAELTDTFQKPVEKKMLKRSP